MDPFASLTVTYGVSMIFSLVLHYVLGTKTNLIGEYHKLNWAPFVLGMVIIGLEVGFIYAYRVGWKVNSAQVVSSSFLAIVLMAVGYFIYKEEITATKIIGMAICLIGLYFINK